MRSASGSRGASSNVARRSNSSVTSLRSSGVIGRLLSSRGDAGICMQRWWRRNDCSDKYLPRSGRLRQRAAVAREQAGERFIGEEGVLLLTQGRQRIEPLQLGIDEAWVAHDHAAVRQLFEKAREHGREIRLVAELVGAREGRIGANAERRGTAPE